MYQSQLNTSDFMFIIRIKIKVIINNKVFGLK